MNKLLIKLIKLYMLGLIHMYNPFPSEHGKKEKGMIY